jgi:hypothetical protein
MRCYSWKRAKRAGKRPECAEALRKAASMRDKRRAASARGHARRRGKLLEHMDSLKIEIPEMTREKLVNVAIESYNQYQISRGGGRRAHPGDGKWFLDRISLNTLRHEFSCYEEEIGRLFGRTGRKEAYAALRKKVDAAIVEVYPHLKRLIDEE